MKLFVAGDGASENIYTQVDPTTFSEVQFEAEVHKAFNCLMPNYWCRVFSGAFMHEEECRRADLVMVRRDFAHWYVVEVEIAGHSLDGHVLPQLRCFRFGEPAPSCLASLMSAFPEFEGHQAKALLEHVPRSTLAVTNLHDPTWKTALRALDTDMLTVSVYRDARGQTAYELEGKLSVRRESLGFARFSAMHDSIRMAKAIRLPAGLLQIEDQFGNIGEWTVTEDSDSLWLTKNRGPALLPHDALVQILRSIDGRIQLRSSLSA